MKVVAFVRERAIENESFVDTFLVPNEWTIEDAERAIREAVAAFLSTDEAKTAVQYAGGDFNWGDALCFVPDEFFSKRGIVLVAEHELTIKVNQDEVLYPELQKRFLTD